MKIPLILITLFSLLSTGLHAMAPTAPVISPEPAPTAGGSTTIGAGGTTAAAGAGAGAQLPVPQRDGSLPYVQIGEDLNPTDYKYPDCLANGGPVAGDCFPYEKFYNINNNSYSNSRTINDLLNSGRWEAPAYNSEGVLFGSSISINITNPPNGGTCKLHRQSAGGIYVDIGTSFSGKVQHGSQGVLDDGNTLFFRVTCNYYFSEPKHFVVNIFPSAENKAAAIIFQEDIPGPILTLNQILGGKKSIIQDGTRQDFLSPYDQSVVEATTLKNSIDSLPSQMNSTWAKCVK